MVLPMLAVINSHDGQLENVQKGRANENEDSDGFASRKLLNFNKYYQQSKIQIAEPSIDETIIFILPLLVSFLQTFFGKS